jgi:hypothetical protein
MILSTIRLGRTAVIRCRIGSGVIWLRTCGFAPLRRSASACLRTLPNTRNPLRRGPADAGGRTGNNNRLHDRFFTSLRANETANGSRERAPDDRLREAIQREPDCFVAGAP